MYVYCIYLDSRVQHVLLNELIYLIALFVVCIINSCLGFYCRHALDLVFQQDRSVYAIVCRENGRII